jgi:non-homologous end joining protein Ku
MAKIIEQLKKAAERAKRAALTEAHHEYASNISNLAEAFRAQAEVMKKKGKKKSSRKSKG